MEAEYIMIVRCPPDVCERVSIFVRGVKEGRRKGDRERDRERQRERQAGRER